MSKTQVITLRIPLELKKRLEREAKFQGVSMNQLNNYLLTVQLTQMEMFSSFESRLMKKSIPELKLKAEKILNKIPGRRVPAWDRKNHLPSVERAV